MTCEVCGEQATSATTDTSPGEPVKDGQGRLWSTWVVDARHFYCDLHYREPSGGPCPPLFAVGYWLAIAERRKTASGLALR